MKIYFVRMFLPFFIFFVGLWPVTAMAFTYQDVALLAPYVVTGGSVAAGASVVAASVAGMGLAVGMTVGYFAVCPIVDSIAAVMGSNQPCVDIPSSTAASSSTPFPSASATAPSGTTTAGYYHEVIDGSGVVKGTPVYCGSTNTCNADTALAACQADGLGDTSWNNSTSKCSPSNFSTGVYVDYGTTTCPAGYTLTGSTCNLSDPYAVAGNENYKRHEVTRSGTTLTVNLVSGSPSPMHEKVMTVVNSNDTISVSGKETSGNLVNTTSIANSDGGSTTTITTGDTTSATQTTATTDSTGKVVSTTAVICASGMVFTATDGSVSAANCGTSTAMNSGSGVLVTNTVSGNLPKALNTSAMSGVTAQANSMSGNLSTATTTINGIGANTGSDNTTNVYGGDDSFSKLAGSTGSSWDWWRPDLGATVACTDVVTKLSLRGGSQHFDVSSFVCGYVDNIRDFLDWTINIGTVMYVFNLMFYKET